MYKNKTFDQVWEELGDVCINEDEEIDTPFYHFPVGTHREDIWSSLENHFNMSIGDYMCGK